MPTPTACDTCLGVLQRRERLYDRQDFHFEGRPVTSFDCLHHASAHQLDIAASLGCPFCSALWDTFTTLQKQILLSADKSRPPLVTTIPPMDDDSLRASSEWSQLRREWLVNANVGSQLPNWPLGAFFLTLTIFNDNLGPLELETSFTTVSSARAYFRLDAGNLATCDIIEAHADDITETTASMEIWKTAIRWIDSCVESHPLCSHRRRDFRYPSRLLYCPASTESIRLQDCRTSRPSGEYLTLSHRWGCANFLKLQRGNLERLQNGFALHELAQAFRDAITICRRLRISYIWIDSLCIIQDDSDDWAREAALMHQVYSHAFLNISAVGAKDSSHSFFTHRDPGFLRIPIVKALRDWTSPDSGLREYSVFNTQMWENELLSSELNCRAWVLQERLLAQRVLHFGSQRLFWECRQTSAAEKCPSDVLRTMAFSSDSKSMDLAMFAESRRRRTGKDFNFPAGISRYLWNSVVDTYTKCHLTKPSDKLVALSGVAKYVAALNDDEYIAGMWRKYLAYEILWHRDEAVAESAGQPRRPLIYRAPTWSWASLDGAVSTTTYTGELLLQVLDPQLEFASDDITGQVTGGSLTLVGHLKKVTITVRPDDDNPGIDVDDEDLSMCISDLEPREDGEPGSVWEESLLLYLDELESIFNPKDREDLYCMPARASDSPIAEIPSTTLDLLLLRLVDDSSNTCERIGIAISSDEEVVRFLSRKDDQGLRSITLI